MRKKVYIVSYYWPPAGGPGVQRWLKFVKYLPDFGVEPVVVLPENPHYPLQDPQLSQEVAEDLKRLYVPIWEPYQLGKMLGFKQVNTISSGIITPKNKRSWKENLLLKIRGNLFMPDARVAWVKPVVQQLAPLLKEEKQPILITTGPPHSLHLIGLELQQLVPNLHWIADFRDPWTSIGYHKELNLSSWAEKRHLTLEKKVVQAADQLIVTSPFTQRDFQLKTDRPVHWISNGFDKEQVEATALSNSFRIAHIGSLLSARNPIILWEVLAELKQEHSDFAADLQLQLVGKVSQDVIDSIANFDLSSSLDAIGYVTHQQAVKYQNEAQVLLLIEIDSADTRAILPGKLYEYMSAKRPIVAIGPKGSDIPTLLDMTQSGNYFNYDEKEALKAQIWTHYLAFKAGNLVVNSNNIEAFSRKALTEKLVKILP